MKNISLTVFFILIIGLQVEAQIVGKYAEEGIPHSFTFYPDSTFKYEFKAFHNFKYSNGRWSLGNKNKYILLNSAKQSLLPKGEIISLPNRGDSEKRLLFLFRSKNDFDIQDFQCQIVINDTIYDKLKNGVLLTSGKTIEAEDRSIDINNLWKSYFRCSSLNAMDSIKINTDIRAVFLRFIYNPLRPNSSLFTNNIISTSIYTPQSDFGQLNFKFYLEDSLFFLKVFNMEKIKVERNKIRMLLNNKWQKIRRAPASSKIFLK